MGRKRHGDILRFKVFLNKVGCCLEGFGGGSESMEWSFNWVFHILVVPRQPDSVYR